MVVTLIGSAGAIDVGEGSVHVPQVLDTANRLSEQLGYFPVARAAERQEAAEKSSGPRQQRKRVPKLTPAE
jgi:hypothetical protein